MKPIDLLRQENEELRRRLAETEHRNEQRFGRFMEHLPGLAWIKDLEGRYVYANDAAVQAFGVPWSDMAGKTDEDLFPPDTATQFRANDRPGPIHMLNLVRLRAQAAYPDGRKATGAEAYAAYGRESGPVFERLGGRIVWQGRFELMLIGPAEECWDHCFIAEYPSVAAFALASIHDPDRDRPFPSRDREGAVASNAPQDCGSPTVRVARSCP